NRARLFAADFNLIGGRQISRRRYGHAQSGSGYRLGLIERQLILRARGQETVSGDRRWQYQSGSDPADIFRPPVAGRLGTEYAGEFSIGLRCSSTHVWFPCLPGVTIVA